MSQNILLLQGPIGPFFNQFAKELEQADHTVHKINFNGGDDFYYSRKNTHHFTGSVGQWRDYLGEKLRVLDISRIYLFGDCRVYHEAARKIAQSMNIRVFVFEEGYIRPNCITLEEIGVNGHSKLPRNPAMYPYTVSQDQPILEPVRQPFRNAALYGVIYYTAAKLMAWKYPKYEHHRPLNLLGEGSRWLLSGIRKMWYSLVDQDVTGPLFKDKTRYFICPLQVHTDMQVQVHSRFKNLEEFIQDVIHSFAANAPDDTLLVFKHHPLDRGHKDYGRVIRVLGKLHKVESRIRYVHDGHLPTLFDHALGTITINSTAGLSSIDHGTPVITLGDAIYDLPGLTYKGELDHFWNSVSSIDPDLRERFRAYLLSQVQANGNFYRRLKNAKTSTGIHWPPAMATLHGLNSRDGFARPAEPFDAPTPPVSAVPAMANLGGHYSAQTNEALATPQQAAEEPPLKEKPRQTVDQDV